MTENKIVLDLMALTAASGFLFRAYLGTSLTLNSLELDSHLILTSFALV